MNKLFKLVALLSLAIGAFAQIEVPNSIKNDTVTGTTTNKLVKLNTTGGVPSVIVTATTDTTGAIGICESGCGTTGVSGVITLGKADCIFDNTTVTNDYVQISSGTAGDCHDAGATRPTSGQIIGTVFAAGGTAGTYTIYLNKDIYPSAAPGPLCSLTGSSDTLSQTVTSGIGTFATVCPIPTANAGVGQVLQVIAHGTYTTNATASPVLNLQVNGGGTSGVCSYSANISVGASNTFAWDLDCKIRIVTTGAPGTATAWGLNSDEGNLTGSNITNRAFNSAGGTVSFTTNSTQNISIGQTATMVSGESATLTDLVVRNY